MPEKSHSNWYRKGGISMSFQTNIITGTVFGGQVNGLVCYMKPYLM